MLLSQLISELTHVLSRGNPRVVTASASGKVEHIVSVVHEEGENMLHLVSETPVIGAKKE